MSLLKRCPICNRNWPDGKDPAEAETFGIMRLRVVDLTKGLVASSTAMEADVFRGECGPVGLKALAQRLLEIEAAKDMLEIANSRLDSAIADLGATPVAMEAIAYIQERGKRCDCDSLDVCHKIVLGDYYAATEGSVLRVGEVEDDG